jgi:hypothetical protein
MTITIDITSAFAHFLVGGFISYIFLAVLSSLNQIWRDR